MKLSHVFSCFTLVSHWNSNSRLKLYSVYFQLSGILTNAADVFMRQIKGVDMSALPNVGETIAFPIKEDLGFYTRQSDGVSGMTVTALANFCSTQQPVITNLLNKVRDSDPILNDLAECLKSYAGKEWRLIANDEKNSLFVIDEVCHAILEYYALDARKYKGKSVAVNNYRMIARAGMRLFIWSQTGYSLQALSSEQVALLEAVPKMQEAIAQLQEQIQNLLPVSSDYIPPGWSPEIWRSLPPQDKQHFWFLHHRRSFRPSNQGIEPLELPAVTVEQMKQKQHDEFQQVVGEILEEEKKRIEVIKQELLNQFWAEGGES